MQSLTPRDADTVLAVLLAEDFAASPPRLRCEFPLPPDACGKPAVWTTDDLQSVHHLCDVHCREAFLDNDFIADPVES